VAVGIVVILPIAVGTVVGAIVIGKLVGDADGFLLGTAVEITLGIAVGVTTGREVGKFVMAADGIDEDNVVILAETYVLNVDYLLKIYYICTQFNNNYKLHHESTHN
jgi:hypothetical protein